jgi:hypothetical protein
MCNIIRPVMQFDINMYLVFAILVVWSSPISGRAPT